MPVRVEPIRYVLFCIRFFFCPIKYSRGGDIDKPGTDATRPTCYVVGAHPINEVRLVGMLFAERKVGKGRTMNNHLWFTVCTRLHHGRTVSHIKIAPAQA